MAERENAIADIANRDRAEPAPAQTVEQARAQIDESRTELSDTIEALAAKTDVKAQVKARAEIAKERLAQRAQSISESFSDSLPNSTDKWKGLSDRLGLLLERWTDYARREPLQASITVLLLGILLGRNLRLKRRR